MRAGPVVDQHAQLGHAGRQPWIGLRLQARQDPTAVAGDERQRHAPLCEVGQAGVRDIDRAVADDHFQGVTEQRDLADPVSADHDDSTVIQGKPPRPLDVEDWRGHARQRGRHVRLTGLHPPPAETHSSLPKTSPMAGEMATQRAWLGWPMAPSRALVGCDS